MDIELTIKNYRCFADTKPAQFWLRKGYTGLIGINNSGKSSLLRFFYELRELFRIFASAPDNIAAILREQSGRFAYANTIQDSGEVFCNLNNRDIEIHLRFIRTAQDDFTGDFITTLTLTVKRNDNYFTVAGRSESGFQTFNQLGCHGNRLIRSDGTKGVEILIDPLQKSFQQLATTFYLGSFRNALGILQAEDQYYDLQVGRALVNHWQQLKLGQSRASASIALDLTDQIRRLFDFDTLEINPSRDGKRLLVTINNKPFWLDELGSGLAQFVVVLANLATKRPSFILIDEPELNLHPTLQSRFLSVLGSCALDGVIFATHSIGLARSESNWVYSMTRQRDGSSSLELYEKTPNLAEFLGELSYSQFQELGFEKVLLVEGVSEIKTIRQFLRWHKKENRFVLIHLGGNSLINADRDHELEEITRISTKVFAIIDSERAAPDSPLSDNRKAFLKTCEKLGIECCVLERRATENYLSDGAIKQVKGDKYKALGLYESLTDVPCKWSKTENWLIAAKMSSDDLAGTDLGNFLESI
jgi:predicted ATPase